MVQECTIAEICYCWKVKAKKTVPWKYVVNDLNGEEVAGTFYKNESQKTNQKEFSSNKIKSW